MLENIQPSQMEIPSQLLLKWSIMYMFYISRNLLRFFSMEIPSQLLLEWMEYMFYVSRNLHRFFSIETPSQLLLK
jgi:hypothetical protein